ncbi:histidine kinase [Ichthyenterobacterium sp. W332]|uniref:Histidine kinase n=1 Tax=Microcosmobacter mediterraneus TaxID=3075607 RepID=A0ABU2YLW8_9FLAO|nr:histidine kinase [Ichthyenterobacterium sp. W332]MDT0558896.1 histidine kinase [Ichthyenterobacterium sp. W332]
MKTNLKCIALILLLSSIEIAFSQTQFKENQIFTIRGLVREEVSQDPIKDARIEVNGNYLGNTDYDGGFKIKAKIGDQLIVTHNDFEIVYHTIINDDKIIIEVQYAPSPIEVSRKKAQTFNQNIDSAKIYLKNDVEKSLNYVTEALKNTSSRKENRLAYETLADVYAFWKQYDLAIINYKISLQNVDSNDVSLKLGEVYRLNKNTEESIAVLNTLKNSRLTNWQDVILYENLGDSYLQAKNYSASITAYEKGLKIAQNHLITPKITDLNSKIAQAYTSKGSINKAKEYFGNSLKLANKENKKRALEEAVIVADFQNTNREYDEEIELRKDAVDVIDDLELDSLIDNTSALTPQKQNYKIGNAFFLQKDYDSAIPYLEKSIIQADEREDLVVKKDAARKLSDVHRDAGDFDKARETYDFYTNVVDELYIKKEQELSRVDRFNKKILESAIRISSLESERVVSQSKYEVTEERSKRQELIIYSLGGGLALLLITGYFMYSYIKQQRFTNNLLALKSLRSQMNPHFIFNALNSVNSFIANNDERTANKYLTDFSFLMRSVLENSEEDFIPLQKEIELIELYTKLEHFRFKDKFDYNINIDSNIDIQDFKIPPMLLQPYIENAVWHGLRYKQNKGQLNISIVQKNEDELQVVITDDGIGRERSLQMKTEHQKKHKSTGMSNIKKRVSILNTMYKDKVTIDINNYLEVEDAGTKVVVTLKKD